MAQPAVYSALITNPVDSLAVYLTQLALVTTSLTVLLVNELPYQSADLVLAGV